MLGAGVVGHWVAAGHDSAERNIRAPDRSTIKQLAYRKVLSFAEKEMAS